MQLIELVILIPVILIIFKSKLFNPFKNKFNDEYLSLNTSNALKGVLSVIVILHHASQKIEVNTEWFTRLKFIGFLAVALFFFLSGYGLQKQYINNENYNKKFLLKRLPSILFPYIIFTFIYWLFYYLLGTTFSFSDIFTSIYHGNPIVDYSWYIISIMIFYIGFYLLMIIFKRKYLLMILGSILFNYLYIRLCIHLDFGQYWYCCNHLITLGIILATYEKQIITFIKKIYIFLLPITLFLFHILFSKLEYYIVNWWVPITKNYKLFLLMSNSLVFVILIILISLKLKIGNKVTEYLGKRSLELYLTQGIFIILLRSDIIKIENDILYIIYTLTGTIILASIIYLLDKFIIKQYKKKIKT